MSAARHIEARELKTNLTYSKILDAIECYDKNKTAWGTSFFIFDEAGISELRQIYKSKPDDIRHESLVESEKQFQIATILLKTPRARGSAPDKCFKLLQEEAFGKDIFEALEILHIKNLFNEETFYLACQKFEGESSVETIKTYLKRVQGTVEEKLSEPRL